MLLANNIKKVINLLQKQKQNNFRLKLHNLTKQKYQQVNVLFNCKTTIQNKVTDVIDPYEQSRYLGFWFEVFKYVRVVDQHTQPIRKLLQKNKIPKGQLFMLGRNQYKDLHLDLMNHKVLLSCYNLERLLLVLTNILGLRSTGSGRPSSSMVDFLSFQTYFELINFTKEKVSSFSFDVDDLQPISNIESYILFLILKFHIFVSQLQSKILISSSKKKKILAGLKKIFHFHSKTDRTKLKYHNTNQQMIMIFSLNDMKKCDCFKFFKFDSKLIVEEFRRKREKPEIVSQVDEFELVTNFN